MSLVEQANEKRKQFRQSLESKAVPDRGINLNQRPLPGFVWIEDLRRGRLDLIGDPDPHVANLATETVKAERVSEEVKEATEAAAMSIDHDRKARIALRTIIAKTAMHFGMSMQDLQSPSRVHAIVYARQIGFFLCRRHTLRSLPEIGRQFGGRDHSTVFHGVRKIEHLRQTDPEMAAHIEAIESTLFGG